MSVFMGYTKFNTEQFIAEVQCRPCLWNTNLEAYNNKNFRAKAWEDIAEVIYDDWLEMKVNERYEKVKEIQKKWKGLRDYYSRKRTLKHHDYPRKKKKAPFLEMLSFLNVTKHPDQASNMLEQEEANTMPSAMDSEESRSSDSSSQEQEKPKFNEVLFKSNEKINEYDPDKSFLMSILPDMQSLGPRQNFEFRYEERNETLFYSVLDENVEKYLPIVYTPTVGLVCQKFGLVYRRPRGLFITIADKGHVLSVLKNWPELDIRALVVTDGERILGLGDLGANGMGIPVGKLSLYTALAGVRPHQCLPITLDVGTNNKTLLEDPSYIGLRMPRVRGKEYDEFIDEFMHAVVKRYGHNVLVQFEDFALANAGRLLEKYQKTHCTFNDDIQGTASVSVAGLFAATRVTKKKISDNIILFLGAGSAANGIANLICQAMVEEGMSIEKARDRVFMFDIDGLVTSKRSSGVPKHVKNFAKNLPPEKDFEKFVASSKATCLIGCSTVGGAFTPKILQQMAKNAERPIIFALSNPTSKAECTAQAAYDNTDGRCVFASGSPFPPVKFKGKEYHTGQGNNSYIFPGVALGVIAISAHHIPDSMFLTAARTVAECVTESDLAKGRIYPPIPDLKKISFKIAINIAEAAYNLDIATVYPKPKNLEEYIQHHIFPLKYKNYLPQFYPFPTEGASPTGKTPKKKSGKKGPVCLPKSKSK